MRELSIEDVEAVSGGNNQVEGLALISSGFGLLSAAGLLGASATIPTLLAAPIVIPAALSLALLGGFRFGTPTVTVTEISAGSGAGTSGSDRSDC